MNVKRWFIAFIVVFIIFFALDWFFNSVCLMKQYEATAHLWRPKDEMMGFMPVWIVIDIIWSLLFCYIYTKGYEGKGKGIAEGLRYGLWLGLFVTIPMALGVYTYMPIPGRLALGWFITGMFTYLLCGLVLGLIYKKA
ncbi:MAG: hypothetical protein AB1756_08025 [Acidobacteriota bacterium]